MPLTPDEVVARTFQPTKFREGYDQAEVDDFLDEVVAELRRLNTENEELRFKLATSEKRCAELSRAAAGAAPQQGEKASVAAVARPTVTDQQTQPLQAASPSSQPLQSSQPMQTAQVPAATSAADGRSAGASPAAMFNSVAGANAAAGGAGGVSEAAGMLALAQRLHDEHVRTGERERDRLIGEAKSHADRIVGDAERKKTETLTALERERTGLERKIDELKVFEREYRSRLKAYLESQTRELESQPSVIPGRPPHEVSVTG